MYTGIYIDTVIYMSVDRKVLALSVIKQKYTVDI